MAFFVHIDWDCCLQYFTSPLTQTGRTELLGGWRGETRRRRLCSQWASIKQLWPILTPNTKIIAFFPQIRNNTYQLFMSRKKMHPSSPSWLPSNLWNSATNTSLSVVWIALNCWSSCESISLSTSILIVNTAANCRTIFHKKFVYFALIAEQQHTRPMGALYYKSLPNILLANSGCFAIGQLAL